LKLEEARNNTINAIKAAFTGFTPKVHVKSFSGTFEIKEIKLLFSHTPAVLVAPLFKGKDGIKIVVYLLTKSTDIDPLLLVDIIEDAIHSLPGEGRALIETNSRSLYDKEAGQIGALLWATVFVWPPLAFGDVTAAIEHGPLRTETERIKTSLLELYPAIPVAVTDAERSILLNDAPLNFITIEAAPGMYDSKLAREIKYRKDDNTLWRRTILGEISWPIKIIFWTGGEAAGENLAMGAIESVSSRGTEEGLVKETVITELKESLDPAGTSIFTVSVSFSAQIGTAAILVPTFNTAKTKPE